MVLKMILRVVHLLILLVLIPSVIKGDADCYAEGTFAYFDLNKTSVSERDRTIQITVNLNSSINNSNINVSVEIEIGDCEYHKTAASRNDDYWVPNIVNLIVASRTPASINILIIDDQINETNETFCATIINPSPNNAVTGVNSTNKIEVTIIDDDSLPTLFFSQSTYVIDPISNEVRPVLVIDKPLSEKIVITLFFTDKSNLPEIQDKIITITLNTGSMTAEATLNMNEYNNSSNISINPEPLSSIAEVGGPGDGKATFVKATCVPPLIQKLSSISKVHIFRGSDVTIDCNIVTGTPPVTISWFRNNKMINSNAGNNSTITITDAKDDDNITCEAVNNIGSYVASTFIKVNVLRFNKSAYLVSEGSGKVNIVLTLRYPSPINFDVELNCTDGNAIAGYDYTAALWNISIKVNQTNASFVVDITDDTSFESDETFYVSIVNNNSPGRNIILQPYNVTITIVDDDDSNYCPLSFNMADPIVTEDASKGVKNLYLILNRTDLTPLHTFHVKLIYKDINFTSDNDYHIKRRHIMFHHRLTRYQLFIGIVDDCLLEYDETFSVTAVPQTPQISCNATTRITIVDNDNISVSFGRRQYRISSPFDSLRVSIKLSNPASYHITIRVMREDTVGGIENITVPFNPGETYHSLPPIKPGVNDNGKIYSYEIDNSSLPRRISAGKNNAVKVFIKFNYPYTYMRIDDQKLHLTTPVYFDELNITVEYKNGSSVSLTMEFRDIEKPLDTGNAKEIIVFVPRCLKRKFITGYPLLHFKATQFDGCAAIYNSQLKR